MPPAYSITLRCQRRKPRPPHAHVSNRTFTDAAVRPACLATIQIQRVVQSRHVASYTGCNVGSPWEPYVVLPA